MNPDWKPQQAARDHLLAGCLSFSIFVFLSWLSAYFNGHHLHSTLSEMVHDWDTPEGKIFIPAMLLPAIFFLLSGYPYVLANARVEGHPYGHLVIVLRHFLVNSGLILLAFVPTLSKVDTHAHHIEVYIHSAAAALTFGAFIVSELFVLVHNKVLTPHEVSWRFRHLGVMTSCLILCMVHKALYTARIVGAYSEAWTFRYEMLIGAGLISQCQLIWYYSDPSPSEWREYCFHLIAGFPYAGALIIVGSDFLNRRNQYALPWAAAEALALLMISAGVITIMQFLRVHYGGHDEKVLEGRGDGYGSTDYERATGGYERA